MIKSWIFLGIKIITDIVIINLSFVLAYLIRFGMINLFAVPIMAYLKPLVFINLLWLIFFNLAGLYKLQGEKVDRVDGVFFVFSGVFAAAFFNYVFVVFLYREAFYSRGVVVYASAIALLLLIISREIIWRLYSKKQSAWQE